MTIDEAKFVQTALDLLREVATADVSFLNLNRVQQAIKALEVALGL